MKRKLALFLTVFLTMTAAAPGQTPSASQKPVPKPSGQTVKVAPVIAVQGAKPSPNTVKVAVTPAAKPAVVAVKPAAAHTSTTSAAKTSVVPAAKPIVVAAPAKVAAVAAKASSAAVPAKPGESKPKASLVVVKTNKPTGKPAAAVPAKTYVKIPGKSHPKAAALAVQDNKAEADKKQPAKPINAVGRRDPFVSPVVNLGAVGSGCSSGKRCLAIDQIALKGVVRSETGMIAVVVNAMDKAYFLRENDPVFNGYVTKITGDSIVFKETFKDKLGKPLTRDITKTISRPVA